MTGCGFWPLASLSSVALGLATIIKTGSRIYFNSQSGVFGYSDDDVDGATHSIHRHGREFRVTGLVVGALASLTARRRNRPRLSQCLGVGVSNLRMCNFENFGDLLRGLATDNEYSVTAELERRLALRRKFKAGLERAKGSIVPLSSSPTASNAVVHDLISRIDEKKAEEPDLVGLAAPANGPSNAVSEELILRTAKARVNAALKKEAESTAKWHADCQSNLETGDVNDELLAYLRVRACLQPRSRRFLHSLIAHGRLWQKLNEVSDIDFQRYFATTVAYAFCISKEERMALHILGSRESKDAVDLIGDKVLYCLPFTVNTADFSEDRELALRKLSRVVLATSMR